ncbi:MAG: pyrrolo-quinoline quinone [Acidobacteriota bacterium]|nr:pyrrolo-quinoline quinone [Acidobacteriota bacterium]
MTTRLFSALSVCFAIAFTAGCGGGGASNDGGGPPPLPQAIAVRLTPQAAAVTYTQTQQFTATVENSSNTTVTWAVDGVAGGNATVGTIDATGVYTPPAAAGMHTIVATSVADASKSDSSTLHVTNYAGAFTYHNDNLRTGQNLGETVLSSANVTPSTFGKLFTYTVDGYIYAQPLYVANLAIPGQGFHNVVYVATQHDSVYAFDADGRTTIPLWRVSFLSAGVTTVPNADVGSPDIVPEIGITGTPVIDAASGTLYVVAKTKSAGPAYAFRLHALDLATGTEKFGGPVLLTAAVPGTGDGNNGGGSVPFLALREHQRPALLLDHGVIYIAFASHGDNDPYHGWVLAYNAATLAQLSAFNTTPNGSRGGIWQAGNGPAADAAGNVYVVTGNGTFNASLGGTGYGDSYIRLAAPGGVLTPSDYFTPFNQAILESTDADLGSSGPLLLPDQSVGTAHLLLGAGKQGTIYLLDRDNMGHFNAAGDTQIVQSLPGAMGAAFGTPAYFNGRVYLHGIRDLLKVFTLSGGSLSSTPTARGSPTFGFPGATPTISANGTANGIVWELQVDGYSSGGPAVLHAADATTASEIYSSAGNAARDQAGPAVKFTVPTVANGKVYVGTQTQLDVYGLLP